MKQKIVLFALLFLSIFTVSAATVLQDEPVDISALLATFPLYVVAILPVVGWIKNLIGVEDNQARYLSWVVAVALALVAWAFKLGFFAEFVSWWQVLIIGVLGGFTANGLFNTAFAQGLLALLRANK